jgi:hypothetical protein
MLLIFIISVLPLNCLRNLTLESFIDSSSGFKKVTIGPNLATISLREFREFSAIAALFVFIIEGLKYSIKSLNSLCNPGNGIPNIWRLKIRNHNGNGITRKLQLDFLWRKRL